MPNPDATRQHALAHLDTFVRCILPGALMRIAAWRGQPRHALAVWRDDLRQELAVDCLLHAEQVVELDERQRHRRWLRLTERALRRLQGNPRLRRPLDPALIVTANPSSAELSLPWLDAAHFGNGRLNVIGTHRRLGRGRVWLQRRVDRLVQDLGWTAEREAFWVRRATEALIGLAADQLIAAGAVHSVRPLAAPDQARRTRRLRRLHGHFPVRRSTLAARRALTPWKRPPFAAPSPRELLAQAVSLAPHDGAAWLWTFEACAAEGDLAAAAQALRQARRCPGVERGAQVLARARLCELRGRLDAGVALVRRAQRRWPTEPTLLRV